MTIADGQGVGTIVDDEPRISIKDVTKRERRNGTTLFTFTVTLSAADDQPVTMSFRTAEGTATTSDGDYVAKSGTLTFAPGETTKTITIEVKRSAWSRSAIPTIVCSAASPGAKTSHRRPRISLKRSDATKSLSVRFRSSGLTNRSFQRS